MLCLFVAQKKFQSFCLSVLQVQRGIKDAWEQNVTETQRCLFRRVLDSGAVSLLSCRKQTENNDVAPAETVTVVYSLV